MRTEDSPLLPSDPPQTNFTLLVAEFKESLRNAKEKSVAWWGKTKEAFQEIGLPRYVFNTALGGFFAFCYAWISNNKLKGVAADERWPLNLDTALLNGALVELVVNHLWEEIKAQKGRDRAWLLAALTLSLGLAAPVAAPLFSSSRAAGLQRFFGYGLFALRTGLVASSMVHLKKLLRGMYADLKKLWSSGWGKVKAIFGTSAAFCVSTFYILTLRPGIGAAAQDFFPEGVCQDLDAEHQAILLGALEAIGMAASAPFYWEYVRGGIMKLLSLKDQREAAILLIALCSVVVGYAQASSQSGVTVPAGCSNTEFEFETTHPYKLTRLLISLTATFLMNFRSAVQNDHEKTGLISVLVSGSRLVLEEVAVKPLVWLFKPFVDFTLTYCCGRRPEVTVDSGPAAEEAASPVEAYSSNTPPLLVTGPSVLSSASPVSPLPADISARFHDYGTPQLPQLEASTQKSWYARGWSGLKSCSSKIIGICRRSSSVPMQGDLRAVGYVDIEYSPGRVSPASPSQVHREYRYQSSTTPELAYPASGARSGPRLFEEKALTDSPGVERALNFDSAAAPTSRRCRCVML